MMKLDTLVRLLPFVFVAAGCWVLPWPGRLALFIALLVSFVLLLVPVVTNMYQILVMAAGTFWVIRGMVLPLKIVYCLLFGLCLFINIVFLKGYFSYMKEQKTQKQ